MAGLYEIGRLWRTVRHLRPVQVRARATRLLYRPRPDFSPPPNVRPAVGAWAVPARRRPSMIGPQTFVFLNQRHNLGDIGWDSPNIAKLWLYNLHYFDDLSASQSEDRTAWHLSLVGAWILANPPAHGTGWEAYPVSLRIVNWIKWALAKNRLPPEAIHSLAVQARWLSKRVERHLLGNHLFANGKALIFAGAFFDGPEAEHWLAIGLSIVEAELREQILDDYGHFERSPMYHALVLEDVLDLINLHAAYDLSSADTLVMKCRSMAPGMEAWLRAMSHPDGHVAFFNDAAFGIVPDNHELFAYAVRLGLPRPSSVSGATHLQHSGYVRLSMRDAVVLVDLACIGPDYLPGHAHADTLSFEMSIGAQRVVVNSGTSVYGNGTERLRQRGTAAHSTVVVDGKDSSEVWSGFRVGRRARMRNAEVQETRTQLCASGCHDGYRFLAGSPIHCRTVSMRSGMVMISDRLDNGARWGAEARFHLHPDISVTADSPDAGTLSLPDGRRVLWKADPGPVRVEDGTWHPEFGMTRPNLCLVATIGPSGSNFEMSWTD